MAKASVELEKLVQKIQQQLAPRSQVQHNVKLPGRTSGVSRQIDVLVTEKIGQYTINIVLDCKDHKHAIDIKGVEEFYGLLQDVGAQKGVLVCPSGFTAAAKTMARAKQIELYSPVDTDAHKWRARVEIPATCDFRSATISFGLSFSSPVPFQLPQDFFSSVIVYNENKRPIGTIFDNVTRRWNEGIYPTEVGETSELPAFDQPVTLVDNGYGMLVPVNLYVKLSVTRALYYGPLSLTRLSGFKDELTGRLITNAFETGILDPNEVSANWQRIDTLADAPLPPVIEFRGVVCWAEI